MVRTRVEVFELIRRDRRDGLSIRELADRHGVHRRTVWQALASTMPPPRKPFVAVSKPSFDPWIEVIDGWLSADREIPRKQRHMARRVWQRLIAEHRAVVSESTVSRYVACRTTSRHPRRPGDVAHADSPHPRSPCTKRTRPGRTSHRSVGPDESLTHARSAAAAAAVGGVLRAALPHP